MRTAKIFCSGGSQAVRLPTEFRFEQDEVRIRRHGQAVILEPVAVDCLWLDALIGPFDEDFERTVDGKLDQQQRPELDFFE